MGPSSAQGHPNSEARPMHSRSRKDRRVSGRHADFARLRERMRTLAIGCLAAAGCALTARNVARAPLQDEGEVALMLAALPEAARGLSFEVQSVSAARADGTEVPLTVVLGRLSRQDLQGERLLARGALPPGAFRGFELQLAPPKVAGAT